MNTRELPELTLADVYESMETPGEDIFTLANKVKFDLTSNDPKIMVEDFNGSITLPVAGAVNEIGAALKIPDTFLTKLDVDIAETLINSMLARTGSPLNIRHGDNEIYSINSASQRRVEPIKVVEVIERVMPENSQIVEFYNTSKEFHLDIVVPEGHKLSAGDRKVGDVSNGGLRVHQKGPIPTVEQYWYRLVCTNGMTMPATETLKMNQSADDFLVEFEDLANRVFWQVEESIKAFYDLRNHRVEDISQAINRWTKANNVSARTRMELIENAPEYFATNSDTNDTAPTRFDVANYITNSAVDPAMPAQTRYSLESAGGSVVNINHSCPACQSILR